MYLNTKGVSFPRGFGMGGAGTHHFRLWFDEEFENCTSKGTGLSFESGPLASEKHFQINVLEIFGVGKNTQEALAAQRQYRKETTDLINKARKVDKAQFAGS